MTKVGEIELPSGRRLYLRTLEQYKTYMALLEGLPTDKMNRRMIESLLAKHKDSPHLGEPYLIQPVETPIEYHGDTPYPFGTPSALPEVTCLGWFESFTPARDVSQDYSGLLVIWFQDEFAFPIAPDVMDRILAIDWNAHAADLQL